MSQLSIIIPFYTDCHQRVKIFKWVIRYYKKYCPDAQICVGSSSHSPFSKAKAVNEAFKKATGSILAIIDADIICNPNVLLNADHLLKTSPWIIPYEHVCNISKKSTNELLNKEPTWPLSSNFSFVYRSQLPVGGANILKRESFEAIGGFDERFQGWGGEDDAFVAAMNTICGHYTRTNDTLFHLWHPFSQTDPLLYKHNASLALQYCRSQGRKHKIDRLIRDKDRDHL